MEKHPALEVKKRSLKLKGESTSVELEKAFWAVIDQIAKDKETRWETVVAALLAKCPAEIPRSRWLRVACLNVVLGLARKGSEQQK